MKTTKRRKARPLLLATAGATLLFVGCGNQSKPPSGNLMASPYDASVPVDASPSGNLLVAPFDMEGHD